MRFLLSKLTFQFRILDGCVHYFEGTSGTLTSPRYPGYSGSSDCLYVIRNAAGQPTKLELTNLDLAGDGDFVEIIR
ncbi:hypothetical protein DPMN_145964 [Dreissena polymorpha]|uniref:CUB domain-containing protein n=1 Tax=Dreissena polymorpha TaxID=45954 RepID=A0A9D4FAX5_DREPO|nr:hypothetical protein DPMN_145964 [Dreissena polymorpha]